MFKHSYQREQILKVVRSVAGHLTAEEVYARVKKKLPRISLATVYRNLHLLSREEKVRALQFEQGPLRYDRNVDSHAHFLCERCGRIIDIPSPISSRKRQKIEEAVGCRITNERLDFYGVCPQCSPKKNKRRYYYG